MRFSGMPPPPATTDRGCSRPHDPYAAEPAFARKSFIHMQTSTQYRAFAEECRRLAKLAKSENERAVLDEMAAAWQMLAEEADRKESRAGS
jgi:hypothetical protein